MNCNECVSKDLIDEMFGCDGMCHESCFQSIAISKKPTNADRLNAMSIEEKAKELARNPAMPCRLCELYDRKLGVCRAWDNNSVCTTGYAEALISDWLKQEAEEQHGS